jgi:hypothetical protein
MSSPRSMAGVSGSRGQEYPRWKRNLRGAFRSLAALAVLAGGSLILGGSLLPAGCSGEDSSDPGYLYSWASVDSARVVDRTDTSVTLALAGSLPEGCSELVSPKTTYSGSDSALVEMRSRRPADAMCTQALKPYRHDLVLDVSGSGPFHVRFTGWWDTLLITVEAPE